jgi:RNA-binding protein
MPPLTPKQRQHLRALAHHLDPVATVGLGGVSDAVVAKVTEELGNHELIKVRVTPEAPEPTRETGDALAAETGAERVQVIGRIVVLYKRRPKKPKIQLPPAT